MPFQFRVGRSCMGVIRLVGVPPRTTRLGEVLKGDVLPAGLAYRQPVFGGHGRAIAATPASASHPAVSGASARSDTGPVARAEAKPVAPGSGRSVGLPVPSAFATPTSPAQAEGAPTSPLHAVQPATPKAKAKREEAKHGEAGEEGWP